MTIHSTFSITCSPDSWPGLIREMSKQMGVKTTGSFRHSFEALARVVVDVTQRLSTERAAPFLEVVGIHAAQPGVVIAGEFDDRRKELISNLTLMNKKDLAEFVTEMPETEFVVMVELARWRRAFGDQEFGSTGDSYEVDLDAVRRRA